MGVDTGAIATTWKAEHGHSILETTDIGSLTLLRDDLRTQAQRTAPQDGQEGNAA